MQATHSLPSRAAARRAALCLTLYAALAIAATTLLLPGCGGDEGTNPNNTAPTASFTVEPGSGTTATTFQFDASGCSDGEDTVSALQVRWDWEDDQTWDTQWSAIKTATRQYATSGSKTVRLQVKDSGGMTDDTTRAVSVGVATSITVVFPNGGETWVGGTIDTVRWTWTGSIDSVRIDYSTNGGSSWGMFAASIPNTGSYAMRSVNTSSTACRLKISSVSDPSISDTSDANYTITFHNTPPIASFWVTPEVGTVDSVFQFDAYESSDAESPDYLLQVRWDWEDDGTFDTGWSTEKAASHEYATPGTKTVRLEVKDTGDLTDDATATVRVSAGPPAVILTSPADQATDVSPFPTIEVWFSDAMDVASIDTPNFHIDGVSSRAIFYDTVERAAILYPAAILGELRQYEVHVGAGVKDDLGIPMGQEVAFSFTTGPMDCGHLADRYEPNDEIASAAPISSDGFYPGLTSCGGSERLDFYTFTLTQPQKVKVTIEAADADTEQVAWAINFERQDGSAYSSMGTSLGAGQHCSIYHTFLPGTYWLKTGKYNADSHIVAYHLVLEELPPAPDDQYEDNDFFDQATPIQTGLYQGLRGAYVDADYYAIALAAGQTLTVTVTEVTSTGTTRRLAILDPDEVVRTGHTDQVNPAVESWTAATTGTYRMEVRWWQDNVIYDMNVQVED